MPASKNKKDFAPYWATPGAALYLGDVRACLRQMSSRLVHCCITSPPYWALRDYGTGTWEGGSPDCNHKPRENQNTASSTLSGSKATVGHATEGFKPSSRADIPRHGLTGGTTTVDVSTVSRNCPRCGAVRVDDDQIGMEQSPDCGTQGRAQCGGCFVCSMVSVFREVYRVLRDDGTLWLNLGDTYAAGNNRNGLGGSSLGGDGRKPNNPVLGCDTGMDKGNLVGIPWRVALALQADGWILRQDIIWHSPNKMPESVSNRCTKSHEHIFLLAKGEGYYYDSVAIDDGVANKRDVWIVPTTAYKGAHFACYSPKLITPCLLAGTSEHGCCATCLAPYERVITKVRGGADQQVVAKETVGWHKTCGCVGAEVVPATVLDPFVGSGTTVATAIELGRHGVGIDLSEAYLRECAIPRIEAVLGTSVDRARTSALPAPRPPVPKVVKS